MNKSFLIIRADADTRMGSGHLMRCLALGQAWRDLGGQVIFITNCLNEHLLQLLKKESFIVHQLMSSYPDNKDWQFTKALIDQYPEAWLVLDGYHFDSDYQNLVKEVGCRFIVIDDMAHLPHYYSDILVNQNIYAKDLVYSCESNTEQLLGTAYVLLRKEFLKWQRWKREVPERARKILITLGGVDSNNVTLKVVQALNQIKVQDLEVKVIVGPANPNLHSLRKAVDHALFPIDLLSLVANMSELIAWADLAISAGGSTCWELAFLGLPALLIVIAENQIAVANAMECAGAAKNLGWFADVNEDNITMSLLMLIDDAEYRQRMTLCGRQLIDGHGAGRVCAALVTGGLYLRLSSQADCHLLWNWANDPFTRQMAVNSVPIPFEEHTVWFEKKSSSEDTLILILERNTKPIGQIRFDFDHNGFVEIDFFVAHPYRRQSLGTYMLREGIQRCKGRTRKIIGRVRPENLPSRLSFEKAGFRYDGIDIVQSVPLMRFVWHYET